MGLIDRIKSRLGGGEATPAAESAPAPTPLEPLGSQTDVERALQEQVASGSHGEFTAEMIPVDAALFDEAFLDSLGSAQLMRFIQDRYRVSIDEVALVGNLTSLAEIAAHIVAECETNQPPRQD